MLVYDSMRVRDDLRDNGDNVFWVRESDYNELSHKLESAKVERDNARDQRDQLREALEAHRDNLRDLLDDEECAPVVRLYFDREDLYHMNAALKATEEG